MSSGDAGQVTPTVGHVGPKRTVCGVDQISEVQFLAKVMKSRTTDCFDLLFPPIPTPPPKLGGAKTTPESVAGDVADLLASRDDPAARCGSLK